MPRSTKVCCSFVPQNRQLACVEHSAFCCICISNIYCATFDRSGGAERWIVSRESKPLATIEQPEGNCLVKLRLRHETCIDYTQIFLIKITYLEIFEVPFSPEKCFPCWGDDMNATVVCPILNKNSPLTIAESKF